MTRIWKVVRDRVEGHLTDRNCLDGVASPCCAMDLQASATCFPETSTPGTGSGGEKGDGSGA